MAAGYKVIPYNPNATAQKKQNLPTMPMANPDEAYKLSAGDTKPLASLLNPNAQPPQNVASVQPKAQLPAPPIAQNSTAAPNLAAQVQFDKPLILPALDNVKFQTTAQAVAEDKGFQPMQGMEGIYQGNIDKNGKATSFADLPSLQGAKFGITTLPDVRTGSPSRTASPEITALPETPWQNMSGYQAPAIAMPDNTQQNQAIKDSMAAISNAQGGDVPSLLKAKYASKLLEQLQGNNTAQQRIQLDEQQQAQQESQFQRNQQQQSWQDLLGNNLAQQKLGLDTQHLGLQQQAQENDNQRLKQSMLPALPKPNEYKPVVEEIANADGTINKTVSAFDPLTGKVIREPAKQSELASTEDILNQYNAAIAAGNEPLATQLKKHYQDALAANKKQGA